MSAWLAEPDLRTGLWGGLIATGLCVLALLAPTGATASKRPLGVLRTLLGLAVLVAMIALAATGFSAIFAEQPMDGWALWLHVSVGGAFTVMLALGALLWLPRLLTRGEGLARCVATLALLSAGTSAGSILIATFPILDTIAMERAHDIHRWAGIATVPSLVALAVIALRQRRARRQAQAAGQSHANASAVVSA